MDTNTYLHIYCKHRYVLRIGDSSFENIKMWNKSIMLYNMIWRYQDTDSFIKKEKFKLSNIKG